jgi:ribonuclease HII
MDENVKTMKIRAEPASLGGETPIGGTPLCDGPAKRVGVDEAGRGPLFGRVYAAAVLLNEGFDVTKVKDSKKFTSEKKRAEAAEYIQANSLWSVAYVDEGVIDQINILQATLRCMHTAINGLLDKLKDQPQGVELLVDGNCFKPLFRLEEGQMIQVPHTCIEKGDALHPCISAASILAKVARDNYVLEMCEQHPDLNKYGLVKNKGYGTKAHRDAIQEHGLSPWHRKSFGVSPPRHSNSASLR